MTSISNYTPEQLNEYFRSNYDALVLDLVTVSAIAIVAWEHLLLMPAEIRTWKLLFAGKVLPARVAVLITRYSVIGAMLATGIFFFGRPENCQATFKAIYGLYTVLWAAASSIFLMRLDIIYNGDKRVMGAFYILWLSVIGCWIALDTGFQAMKVPTDEQQPYATWCRPKEIPKWGATAWCMSMIFDTAVLLATWWRLWSMSNQQGEHRNTRTRQYIINSNLWYFTIAFFFNCACFAVEIAVNDPIFSHMPSPVAFCMNTVVSSRLVLSAEGWAADTSVDEDYEMGPTVNSFLQRKRKGQVAPTTSISYVVDETVVTSPAPMYSEGEGGVRRGRTRRAPPSAPAPVPSAMKRFDNNFSALDHGSGGQFSDLETQAWVPPRRERSGTVSQTDDDLEEQGDNGEPRASRQHSMDRSFTAPFSHGDSIGTSDTITNSGTTSRDSDKYDDVEGKNMQ